MYTHSRIGLSTIFTVGNLIACLCFFRLEACKYPFVKKGNTDTYRSAYAVGDTVTYECMHGYKLDGPTTATCNGVNCHISAHVFED